MKYQAEVKVTLKNGVRDPQGAAINTVLKRTSIEDNPNAKVGKYFTLDISAPTKEEALKKLDNISQDLLSNPILEKYEIIKVNAL